MLYTPPILGLDLIASLAAAAFEVSLPDPAGDLLKDDHSATAADWGDGLAEAYVSQVRSSGRALIAAETAMLSSHRSLEVHVETWSAALCIMVGIDIDASQFTARH